MKLFFGMLLLVCSFSSFAGWSEVECSGKHNGKEIELEVEQPFPNGAYFKRALLSITETGATRNSDYMVTTRSYRYSNKVTYSAFGFDLEVDFWPDQYPRWGSSYRAKFRNEALGNEVVTDLKCRFPNAQ